MRRLIVCCFAALLASSAFSEVTKIDIHQSPTAISKASQNKRPSLPPVVPTISAPAKSWVLMSSESGQVLASHDANATQPPASLTKLMTAYVVLQAIHAGHIHLQDIVRISTKAAKTGGSRMFLKIGEKVSVENLLKGMIIESGNDAAVALAEHVAGTEAAFAHMMNHSAKQLGMTHSHFINPNGLPAEDQYSSAHDMAVLARAIITHFPKAYRLYSVESFTWNGITQHSRNILMRRNPQVDGLKTGYTKAAKYCLVASQHDNNQRMIAVVMGVSSPQVRADAAQKLLTFGLRFYRDYTLYQANKPIESVKLKGGKQNTLPIGTAQNVTVTLPRGHYQNLKAAAHVNKNLKAPIKQSTVIGQLVVTLKNKTIQTVPLIALTSVAKGSWYHRIVN